MRFYTKAHKHYCGIDLHAKTMYLCILDHEGTILLHRNMPCDGEKFLKAIAPYREDLVVSVECMFTWYWLADLCAREKIHFVLGHALYMKAIHGGKAKNDKIDAQKIAILLRGGMLPQSYVYPAEWRATRDLVRRRISLVRTRAKLLAHLQNTRSQYNLDAFEKRMSGKSKRDTIATHFAEGPVRLAMETNAKLILRLNELITDLESNIVLQAEGHDYDTYFRLRSIPGIGETLGAVIMYEIHDIHRFPTVGDFVSYSRLVKCSHESAGKKKGHGGSKMGNAFLKWAFNEAAVLFAQRNERAKALIARLEVKHGRGKAYSILGQRIGRSVFYMLKRKETFNEERFFAS